MCTYEIKNTHIHEMCYEILNKKTLINYIIINTFVMLLYKCILSLLLLLYATSYLVRCSALTLVSLTCSMCDNSKKSKTIISKKKIEE